MHPKPQKPSGCAPLGLTKPYLQNQRHAQLRCTVTRNSTPEEALHCEGAEFGGRVPVAALHQERLFYSSTGVISILPRQDEHPRRAAALLGAQQPP